MNKTLPKAPLPQEGFGMKVNPKLNPSVASILEFID